MHPQAITSVRWLLNELQDPFVMFPLQSVSRSLSEVVADSLESLHEREGPYGVAQKFWDVPMELLHEEVGLLIGSAFVLGQATLTQSVAIVSQLRHLAGEQNVIPTGKRELLETEADRDSRTNLSYLVIIDTAANFFKHRHEWATDWHTLPGRGIQAKTMADAYKLGLRGHELTDNMYTALQGMGDDASGVSEVAIKIQRWRERLAQRFSQALDVSTD